MKYINTLLADFCLFTDAGHVNAEDTTARDLGTGTETGTEGTGGARTINPSTNSPAACQRAWPSRKSRRRMRSTFCLLILASSCSTIG